MDGHLTLDSLPFKLWVEKFVHSSVTVYQFHCFEDFRHHYHLEVTL